MNNFITFFDENDNTNNTFTNIVNNIFDQFITMPLTRLPVNQDIQDAIQLNNQIISRIHSLRRQIEMDDETIHYRRQVRQQQQQQSTFNIFQSIMEVLVNNDNFLNNNINTDNMEDIKVTLKDEDFKKLETYKLTKDDNQITQDCNICMDSYKENDIITKLKCGHFFHTECIKTWLCQEKISCPICRTDIRNQV